MNSIIRSAETRPVGIKLPPQSGQELPQPSPEKLSLTNEAQPITGRQKYKTNHAKFENRFERIPGFSSLPLTSLRSFAKGPLTPKK